MPTETYVYTHTYTYRFSPPLSLTKKKT